MRTEDHSVWSNTKFDGRIFMTAKTILEEIKPLGNLSYKKVLFNHGVVEPCFGVKIEDLKKIQKRIKKDHQLALDLRGASSSPPKAGF